MKVDGGSSVTGPTINAVFVDSAFFVSTFPALMQSSKLCISF